MTSKSYSLTREELLELCGSGHHASSTCLIVPDKENFSGSFTKARSSTK